MAKCSMGTAAPVSTLFGEAVGSWAWSSLVSYLCCFCGSMIIIWHCTRTKCSRVWFKKLFASATHLRTWCCNNFSWTLMYQTMFGTYVSCELWPLNVYDLGWCGKSLKSFEISRTTGFMWAQVGLIIRFDGWLSYLDLCKLGGSVTLLMSL
jgi:hypothetical protein